VSRAPVAALLSAILPGLGHRYIGRRKIGDALLLGNLLILWGLYLVATQFQMTALRWLVTSRGLILLMLANVALLVYRAWVTSDAYSKATMFKPGPSAMISLGLAIVILLVPHLFFGRLVLSQYDLITSVFAAPTEESPTVSTPEPGQTPGTGTTVPQPRIWDGVERLNILLMGSDMRPDQESLERGDPAYRGHRIDSITVVSINPQPPYDVAMFSVPRFLSNYPLPEGMGDGRRNNDWDWLGHLFRRAEDGGPAERALYPGPDSPGINAMKGALGELFGIPIHYYAMVTVGGFVGLVDALGGIEIDVPRTIIDRNYDFANRHADADRGEVRIEQGRQKLDGFHALAYARIRSQSGEFARMHRQRCVLGALVEQANPVNLLRGFGDLVETLKQYVRTDIPQDRLVDFVELLPNLSTDNFSTLRITLDYEIDAPPGNIRWFDIDQIREDAQFLMRDPVAAREALGLDDLDATCDQTFDPVQEP